MTGDLWSRLNDHHRAIEKVSLVELFNQDPARFENFSASLEGMLFDYSKTSIDDKALTLLLELAQTKRLEEKRDAMFSGSIINRTEGRAVLHTALRNLSDDPVLVENENVMQGIRDTLQRMRAFAMGIRTSAIAAADGGPFTDVVNIGIGGSDLGPAMATLALAPCHDGPRCHFVSNVDGAQISDLLTTLDPNRTLFIVASKTFTTIETMTNATTAKDWITKALGPDGSAHFAAVSTSLEKTAAFDIDPDFVFGFGDWIGGRYSVWGPIGLSLMIAIGPDDFEAFLRGGYEMDSHFRSAPLNVNLPVIMGLVGIWHHSICGYASRAILPYDQRLARLPAYLQQLDMESNGKQVAMDGSTINGNTGPIVWGEPGTNGQHAFYQLIHQGSRVVPCEFLVAAKSHEPGLAEHHDLLLANCLAQSEALMKGRSFAEAKQILQSKGQTNDIEMQAAHRVFSGNRPSTTLVYEKLTPQTLGRIIALYEHRVFVEGIIWGLNSFDQWGVELGKELATAILPLIKSGAGFDDKDGSTRGLLQKITDLKKQS
ncbi:MAG: glucose-6-phosphate isomerase [Proteobacteria bacterium]|nr:glucose-6-phosphate isomerase [Pseudomonadota bacterium]